MKGGMAGGIDERMDGGMGSWVGKKVGGWMDG